MLDVLVLGGGLSGTSAAVEFARAGFAVALLESRDLGRGESGRGSRLLDASLCAVAAGRWVRARNLLHTRRILLRAAPQAIRICPILLPARTDPKTSRLLRLHELLGRPRAGWPAPSTVSLEQTRTLFPGRVPGRAERFALHYGASVDDRRLALLTAIEATRLGAAVLTRSELISLDADGSHDARATIRDQITGELSRVGLRLLINATGSSIDQLRRSLVADDPPPLLESTSTYRLFAASPADAGALVEEPATGAILLAAPVQGGFVLSHLASAPENGPGRLAKVFENAFDDRDARCLTITSPVSRPSRLRRRWIRGGWMQLEKAQGIPFVSFAASSLCEHRTAAKALIGALSRRLAAPEGPVPRHAPRVPGGEIVSLEGEIAAARARGLTRGQARWLIRRFGSEWRRVHDMGRSSDAVGAGEIPLVCEVDWALHQEGVRTLADLLLRWRAPEISGSGEQALVAHAEQLMARRCGWGPARQARERVRWQRERGETYRE